MTDSQWDKHRDSQATPQYAELCYQEFLKLNRKARRALIAQRKRELKQIPKVTPEEILGPNGPG